MTSTPSRLEQRIRRDFPEPGSAHGVLELGSGLPRKAGYSPEMLASDLVDVQHPDRTITVALDPVTQVCSAGSDLIVMASFSDLTAIGAHGQAWTSERLCLDSLRIVHASARSIGCIGDFPDGVEAFTVAASTGELLEGRRFRDTWPGHS